MKGMKTAAGLSIALITALLVVPPCAESAIRFVRWQEWQRGDYTIQDILDECNPGDTLEIEGAWPGNQYQENIFVPPGVTVTTEPAPIVAEHGVNCSVWIRPEFRWLPVVRVETDAGETKTKLNGLNISSLRNARGVHITGDGAAEVELCQIEGNEAERGAGIYYSGPGKLAIKECYFSFNHAGMYGGAVYVAGTCSVYFKDNWYDNNEADHSGGGIRIDGAPRCTIFRDTFYINSAKYGGAVAVFGNGFNTTMTEVRFGIDAGDGMAVSNSAEINGGAVYLYKSHSRIKKCTFYDNQAGSSGGGIYSYLSEPEIYSSIFDENNASDSGGAVCGSVSSIYMEDNELVRNRAVRGAGIFAWRQLEDPVWIYGNTLLANFAIVTGGGIFLADTEEAAIENNVLIRNEAKSGHGIYVASDATADIFNNTIVHAYYISGGGLNSQAIRLAGKDNSSQVINNIIAFHHRGVIGDNNNQALVGWNDFWNTGDPLINVRDFAGNQPRAFPNFVNDEDDFHIRAGSAAINAANAQYSPIDDRDGNRRDKLPDRGAYEFIP